MNQNYLSYSVEDLVADELFQQYVLAPEPQLQYAWEDWLISNPHMKPVVDEASDFLLNLKFKTEAPSSRSIQDSLEKNLAGIAALEQASMALRTTRRRRAVFALAASGLVIILSVFGWSYFINKPAVMVEWVTGPGEVKTLMLPDSSLVTINENSSVSYSSDLLSKERRELWMKGEVFFNVKHIEEAKQKPHEFVVYSGDIKVEVLGTTFNVKSFKEVTNVTLNTGQIKIGVKDDPVSVMLQPGDFIQYSEKEKKLVKRKVDVGLYSTWKEKKLKLDKMPLKEIAQLIHDIYGYDVKIADAGLKDSKISGTLIVNDEATFLETLAFALDINIEKTDSTLTLSQKTKNKKE